MATVTPQRLYTWCHWCGNKLEWDAPGVLMDAFVKLPSTPVTQTCTACDTAHELIMSISIKSLRSIGNNVRKLGEE